MGSPWPDLWSSWPVKDIQKKKSQLTFWLTEVICTGTWFYRALHHSRVVQNRLGPVLVGHLVRSWALSLPSQSCCLSGSTSCHHRVRLFCCLYVWTWRKRSAGKSDCSNWILKPMCLHCHLQVCSADYAVVMVTRLVLPHYINMEVATQWYNGHATTLSSLYSRFRDMAELCLPPRYNILLVAHDAACYKMDALLAECRVVINISVLMMVIVCCPTVMQQARRMLIAQADRHIHTGHMSWIGFESDLKPPPGVVWFLLGKMEFVLLTLHETRFSRETIQLGPKSNLRPQCEPGLR